MRKLAFILGLLIAASAIAAPPAFKRSRRAGFPGAGAVPAPPFVTNLAYEFNGTDERIDFGDVTTADAATRLKIAFWIRWVSGSQGWVIARRNTNQRQFGVLITAGAQLRFYVAQSLTADAFVAPSTLVVPGVWTHVICDFDPSEPADHARIYIDGADAGSLGGTVTAVSVLSTPSVATSLYVGDAALSDPIAMRLAHPAIWVGANAAAMVESEVYGGAADPSEAPDLNNLSTTPPPDHWWPADSANLTSSGGVVDEGTGGANGTAVNMTNAVNLVGVP